MKKSVLLLLLSLTIYSGFSFESTTVSDEISGKIDDSAKGFYFEAGISAGCQFGVITENLYMVRSPRDLYRNSWITWETLPVVIGTFNATVGYQFTNNHSINFEAFFSSAYPDVTGSTEDFDALLLDGRITDFSHHDNYADLFLSTGFYTDYSFSNGVGAGIGFEFQNVHFRAQNGYAQHTTDFETDTSDYWYPEMEHTSTYTGDTVITYDFFSFYWKLGVVWRHELSNHFDIQLDAWLNVYRYNRINDKHWGFQPNVPTVDYLDIVEVGFSGGEIRTRLNFILSNYFELSLRIAGSYLPADYGRDYKRESSNYNRNEGYRGGFDSWGVSATIAAIMKL